MGKTQGRIAQRDRERLGTTDTGVILFRNMLNRELLKVERGEDPIGVIRDPAKNDVIAFPLERDKVHLLDGFATQVRRSVLRFSPFAEDLCKVFAAYSSERERSSLRCLHEEHIHERGPSLLSSRSRRSLPASRLAFGARTAHRSSRGGLRRSA